MTVNPCKLTTFIVVMVVMVFLYNITSNSLFETQSPVVSTRQDNVGRTKHNAVRLWFFALDCDKPHLEFYAKQAVLSALHYTSLVPILMLHCHNAELEGWMKSHGVIIVDPRNSKLVQYLDANPDKLTNLGASTWYRIAIPTVIDELITSKHKQVMALHQEDPSLLQYALYTDADIVFLRNVHIHEHMLPRYFALPVQGDAWCCAENKYSKKVHTNAGVILMNVTSFREIESEFTSYVLKNIVQNKPDAHSFNDQTAFHSFFPIRLPHLNVIQIINLGLFYNTYFKSLFTKYYSDALSKFYEWEPYLGVNSEAVILHWHGPKVFINTCGQLLQHPSTTYPSNRHETTNTTILYEPVANNTTGSTLTNINKMIPPMVTTGANKSMFSDPWQIVLQQLVLYNRTYPYSTHHIHSLPQRNRRLRVHNDTVDPMLTVHKDNTNVTHNKHTNSSVQYPSMYDWYPPMELNEQDRYIVEQLATKSLFYLQTLTPHSLDGYHHATSLFFSYVNLICASSG